MTPEQDLLFALLQSYINMKEPDMVSDKIEWEELYTLAEQQSLSGICYLQIQKLYSKGVSIPEDVIGDFHKAFHSEIYYAVNRESMMIKLQEAFTKQNIPSVPFKGWIVKDTWLDPFLRTMGDLDILIHTEDRAKTDQILLSFGFKRFVDNHAVWTYTDRDLMIEIHDHMFYENLSNQIDYRAYFDQAWDYLASPLWDSYHFIYLIAHMAKHTINKGVGLRAYMDLVFYSLNSQISWEWIFEELEKLKLKEYALKCFAFCKTWFHVEWPFEVPQINSSFIHEVTGKIFRDGTFGLDNPENEGAWYAKEIKRKDKIYGLTAMNLVVSRLFPPYEDMQLIPWYSFVDGRHWLLPFAWVYRWIYCLINKREHGIRIITKPYVKKDIILQRQNYLSKWGL